jgi:uncharacterized protein DUF3179
MIEGKRHTFGVSGLLYQHNLLFYDVETGSLWSQLLSEAVTGTLAGMRLRMLPAANSTWGAWRALHPNTLVLSFETGAHRDYHEDPYASYPLSRKPALLVAVGGSVKIYPFSELKKDNSPLVDRVAGREIVVSFDRRTETAHVENQPAEVSAFVAFFDDLKEFYRDAVVYRRSRR